jgi:hypothetical protein
MTLKYRYSFKTFDGKDCRVDFLFKTVENNQVTILNPGARPFILREFNTDQEFFKHLRPFIAEMEILSNNVSMDDFLSNEDDGVLVRFYYDNVIFWVGNLMQDDFQENWIDTNHYITLRATDGYGTIESSPMPALQGQFPIIDYIGYCLDTTTPKFLSHALVCNLFYNGMDDRSDGVYSALDQTTVDAKTFEGDDKSKILEKITKGWGLTCYQYYGKNWVVRLEEWLTNLPIQGFERFLLELDDFSKTYETNIGVEEDIKPIMPEMLRSIRRPFKKTKINYFYRFPNQIICNQDFQSGDFIEDEAGSGVPADPPRFKTRKLYEVDCWTLLKGTPNASLGSPSAEFYRADDVNELEEVTDSYLEITYNATPHYVESSTFSIGLNDKLKFNFEYRFWNVSTTGSLSIFDGFVVKLVGTSTTYYLTADFTWATTYEELKCDFIPTERTSDWAARTDDEFITTSAAPQSGELRFYFLHKMTINPLVMNFRDLRIAIEESSKKPGVVGDYDQYELPEVINQNYEEETFLDDSNNRQHKGALHFDGDLTGDNWYRMDYPDERLTFKRHKDISHMVLNKRYRQRLEVNMFGNTWLDGSTVKPIWLQNKFVFVDDAPGKKFMIANLSEMDFMNTTWKANLIEVWDENDDPDDYPPHSFANIYKKDV